MTMNKPVYPVNFTIKRGVAGFRGADNRPLFTVKSFDEQSTLYMASTVCKALNAHFGLIRDGKDCLEIISHVVASLGIDPSQRGRLQEIEANLDRLTVKKEHKDVAQD